MRWTETNWFKNVCVGVACIFFSTSASPMAFGFAPPQPRQGTFVPSLAQLVPHSKPAPPRASMPSVASQNIFKTSTATQVSKLLETAQEKLKELELLPELQHMAKLPQEEATSCVVPESGLLVLHKDSPFALSSSSNGKQDKNVVVEAQATFEHLNPHPNLLPAREKEQLKREGEKKEQGRENWLGKLGNALSSLLVSEAYAQELPAGPLDSTPDANTTDQFIIDKAAELTAGAATPQEKIGSDLHLCAG